MDMKRVYLAFCVAMVLTLVPIATSCDSSMEGYRTLTFNQVAHFSFEYPAHYEKYSAHATTEDKAIYIGFRDKIVPEGRINGFIYIYVEGAGITYPDATAALEYEISQFVEPENLLECSNVTVTGISAELLVYSHEQEGTIGDINRVTRGVYFDYNDLIWSIVIESDEDRADVAQADFEHLLETFQILD